MNGSSNATAQPAFYVIGGTLRYDARCYVERQADKDLHAALQQGEFCYVLTPRQLGKSSLMVRTVRKLREEGLAVAVLDLTAIGQNLSVEQWYEGLMGRLGQQFGLEDELEEFWQAFRRLSPVQRLFQAIHEVVMKRRPGCVAIFVDEIDTVRSLPFPTDEFFAAIRECYNRRAVDPEFSRLTFCLLGVATPSDLIRDPRTTPFNIGRRIELKDFTAAEARGLAEGFRAGRTDAQVTDLLKRILHWTHGHPYLTQRLCKAVAEDVSVTDAAGIDALCESLFLSDRARERDDNLIFVRERLLRAEADRVSLLDLYSQVHRGRRVPDDPTSRLVSILRLSGITRVEQGCLVVRMPIYQRVFDRKWVLANMPDAEVRRQREAYRQGIFRAAAVAFLVIAMMAALARYGFQQAELARFNAQEEGLQRKRAESARAQLAETMTQMEVHQTEMMFRQDRSSEGIAYLAHVLRNNPTNRVAAERLLSVLTEHSFGLPEMHSLEFSAAEFSGPYTTQGLIKTITAAGIAIPRAPSDIESLNRLLKQGGLQSHFKNLSLFKDAPGPWKRAANLSEAERIRINRYILEEAYPAQCPKNPELELVRQERAGRGPRPGRPGPSIQPFQPVEDATEHRKLRIRNDTVFILDPQDEPLAEQPLRHDGPVMSARFSPDGQRIVTASRDNTARVWDALTGQPITPPMHHADSVLSAEFDPNGLEVVTASFDHTARIWDAYSGQPLTEPLKHTNFVALARFTPDGGHVITAGRRGGWRVWDVRPGQALAEPLHHKSAITSVDFSPDGQRLVTASRDNTARVWSTRTGLPVTPALRHNGAVNTAQFSPDGHLVATASDDHTARLWEAATGKPALTHPLNHDRAVTSLQFSPDGSRLVTASQDDRTARIWDAQTGQPVGEPFRHEHRVTLARFSRDGLKLVTAAAKPENEGEVFVWEVASRELVAGPLRHEGPVVAAHFDATGRRLVTAAADNTARIWDAATGQPLAEPLNHNSIVNSARFSQDGHWVITASADRTARVWDAQTGLPAGGPLLHDTSVVYARFFPDGQRVLTACSDKSARIWDAQSSQPLSEPLTQEKSVRFAQLGFTEQSTTDLSRDGHWLATANGSGDAFVWEVLTPPLPVPEWLPELAEDIAGDRINQRGLIASPSAKDFSKLRQRLLSSKAKDFHTLWARWFLGDRSDRPLSPSSAVTVKEYVLRRIQENTLASLQEAVRFSPTNALALARLALATLADPAATARAPEEALFLSGRAVDLVSNSEEVWRLRAEVLEKAGRTADALAAIDSGQVLLDNDPELWNLRGQVLGKLKRFDEAEKAFARAVELAEKQKNHEAKKRYQENRMQLWPRRANESTNENDRK